MTRLAGTRPEGSGAAYRNSLLGLRLLAGYSQFAHPVDQRSALHSQRLRGAMAAADHPITRFQRPQNVVAFDLGEPAEHNASFGAAVSIFQLADWRAKHRTRRENHRSLDEVLQFANVSRP